MKEKSCYVHIDPDASEENINNNLDKLADTEKITQQLQLC